MSLFQVWMEDAAGRLYYKRDGKTIIERKTYLPSFYIVPQPGEEERIAWIVSQHPHVHATSVMEKKADIMKPDVRSVVRVLVNGIKHYEQVIKDMRKLDTVECLAETKLPHYLKFLYENKLRFFNEEVDLSYTIAVKGEYNPEADVIITDQRVMEIPGKIVLNLELDLSHDMYAMDYQITNREQLLQVAKERVIRIMELSRETRVRPDLVSTLTHGGMNTYLHISAAWDRGFIIPDTKRILEEPKSLALLQQVDKGGLIFYPEPGIHQGVAKCDFSSMYPSIIVRFNISPETLNCSCCDGPRVPHTNWHFCTKRAGVIPEGIRRVLQRRLELKAKMLAETDQAKKREYNIRQRAYKTILVCCFGYLGYSNFIFSRVECKEAVMLFGREILTQTKEEADAMGMDVLYGITDSVFIKASKEKAQEFCGRVSLWGIELIIDRYFDGLVFPHTRGSGVANKYFGIEGDEIEARGIALRHSDAPDLLKQFQTEAIPVLLRRGKKAAAEVATKYKSLIGDYALPLNAFVITKNMRQKKYVSNAPHVRAYRISPTQDGVSRFVYTYTSEGVLPTHLARLELIDVSKYNSLIDAALSELCESDKRSYTKQKTESKDPSHRCELQ